MTDVSTGPLPSRFNPRIAGVISQGVAPTQSRLVLRHAQDSAVAVDESGRIAAEFEKHRKIWLAETMYHSSPVDRYLHASYARIIGLGWAAVPYILHSLKRGPNDWFYALRAITGDNPVLDSMAGDIVQMSKAWLDWGRTRGLI